MVTCALCKDRLADALEDEGSFRVAEGFKNVDGQPGIAHTCLRCGKRLLEATTAEAVAIMKGRASARAEAFQEAVGVWEQIAADNPHSIIARLLADDFKRRISALAKNDTGD